MCELPVRMWPAATNAKRFDTHRLRSRCRCRSRHRPTLRRVTEPERERGERAESKEQAGWQGQKRHIKHASIDTHTHIHTCTATFVHFQFANFHWKPKWRRAAARSRRRRCRRSWTERRLQAGAVCRGALKRKFLIWLTNAATAANGVVCGPSRKQTKKKHISWAEKGYRYRFWPICMPHAAAAKLSYMCANCCCLRVCVCVGQ